MVYILGFHGCRNPAALSCLLRHRGRRHGIRDAVLSTERLATTHWNWRNSDEEKFCRGWFFAHVVCYHIFSTLHIIQIISPPLRWTRRKSVPRNAPPTNEFVQMASFLQPRCTSPPPAIRVIPPFALFLSD